MDVESVRVNANNLSPMKMAESYWCLFRASWRQSLKNFSIAGEVASADQSQVHELDSIGVENCRASITRRWDLLVPRCLFPSVEVARRVGKIAASHKVMQTALASNYAQVQSEEAKFPNLRAPELPSKIPLFRLH